VASLSLRAVVGARLGAKVGSSEVATNTVVDEQ